jgi:hypothetical protein
MFTLVTQRSFVLSKMELRIDFKWESTNYIKYQAKTQNKRGFNTQQQ